MASRLKAALFTAAVLVPLIGAPSMALGVSSKTADQLGHIVDCLTWLVNNPTKHAKVCAPTQVTQDQLDHMWGQRLANPKVVASSSKHDEDGGDDDDSSSISSSTSVSRLSS